MSCWMPRSVSSLLLPVSHQGSWDYTSLAARGGLRAISELALGKVCGREGILVYLYFPDGRYLRSTRWQEHWQPSCNHEDIKPIAKGGRVRK